MKKLNPQGDPLYLEIAQEILTMAQEDQRMRAATFEDPEKWDPGVDRKNTERLKEIIGEIGWPTLSKVGELASHKAWLLVQHADDNLDFQKLCLDLMKNVEVGEVKLANIAYLEDRIMVSEKQSQLYGTQFYTNPTTPILTVWPIEKLESLDDRRKAMGLEPFKDYEKGMMQKYNKN